MTDDPFAPMEKQAYQASPAGLLMVPFTAAANAAMQPSFTERLADKLTPTPTAAAVLASGLATGGLGLQQGLAAERAGHSERVATILRMLGYGAAGAGAAALVAKALQKNSAATDTDPFAPMEKKAIAPLALLGLLSAGYGAYGMGKHTIGAGKRFALGEHKEGFKELGRGAIEGLYMLPMLRAGGLGLKGVAAAMRAGSAANPALLGTGKALASAPAGATATGAAATGVHRVLQRHLPQYARGSVSNSWGTGAIGGSAIGGIGGYFTGEGDWLGPERLTRAAAGAAMGAAGGAGALTPIGKKVTGYTMGTVLGAPVSGAGYAAGRVLPKSWVNYLAGTGGPGGTAGKLGGLGNRVTNPAAWSPGPGAVEAGVGATRPLNLVRTVANPSQAIIRKFPGSRVANTLKNSTSAAMATDMGLAMGIPMGASALLGPSNEMAGRYDNPQSAAMYGTAAAGRALGGGYGPNTYYAPRHGGPVSVQRSNSFGGFPSYVTSSSL